MCGALATAMRGLTGVVVCASLAASAHASVWMDGVTFNDGGTLTGSFDLNILGYTLSPIDLVATGPTFPSSNTFQSGNVDGSPPGTDFDFVTPGYVYDLHLEFASPIGPGSTGAVALVPGGGTPGNYTGSYEVCTNSPIACGVPSGTASFITGGDALLPEPASLALLGIGLLGTAAARWRRQGAAKPA